MQLPGVTILEAAGEKIELRNRRIPHQQILRALQGTAEDSHNLVQVYRLQVLPIKTRTIHLLGRKGPARIINTLLGFEVQASYKRIHCPDMVTARYLKLFTELGCHTIKLPYDPTVTARLIPEFEAAVERIVEGVRILFPESRTLQAYVLRQLYGIIRSRLRRE
jgi:hypothetical protein